MINNPIANIIRFYYGEVVVNSYNEYKVKCKICGHRALWINPVKNVYNCWSCKDSGRATDLIPELKDKVVIQPIIKKKVFKAKESVLPVGYKPILSRKDYPEAWDYVVSRGVEPSLIDFGWYSNYYITFPVIENGKPVYFQDRTIFKSVKTKTNNPFSPNGGKENYLYNYDSLSVGDICIVVEGVFDALRTGTVATLGKTISDAQIHKINSKKPKLVIIAYDPDAKENVNKYFLVLSKAGIPTIPFYLTDCRDPADLGAVEFYEILTKYLQKNPLARARLKLLSLSVSDVCLSLQQKAADALTYVLT